MDLFLYLSLSRRITPKDKDAWWLSLSLIFHIYFSLIVWLRLLLYSVFWQFRYSISHDFSDPLESRLRFLLGVDFSWFLAFDRRFSCSRIALKYSVFHLCHAGVLHFWIYLALFLKSFSEMLLTDTSNFGIEISCNMVFGVNICIWISSST